MVHGGKMKGDEQEMFREEYCFPFEDSQAVKQVFSEAASLKVFKT